MTDLHFGEYGPVVFRGFEMRIRREDWYEHYKKWADFLFTKTERRIKYDLRVNQ